LRVGLLRRLLVGLGAGQVGDGAHLALQLAEVGETLFELGHLGGETGELLALLRGLGAQAIDVDGIQPQTDVVERPRQQDDRGDPGRPESLAHELAGELEATHG
jgi:hypothetical protein